MSDGLTIEALGERVREALAGQEEPASGRVRAIPDVRTIRYYTTLGLLDRPAEMRGRTALYADKHVLQLVAIKRLQAEGRSLEQIQVELGGATRSRLEKIARISSAPHAKHAQVAPSPRAESFWREAPEASAAAITQPNTPASVETEVPARALSPTALSLAPGVLLVLERAPPMTDDDRRRLTDLAAPLIEALDALGKAEDQEG